MPVPKLQLDKESLARLQEDQLQQLNGGVASDDWGSTLNTEPIEPIDDGGEPNSCCRKTC